MFPEAIAGVSYIQRWKLVGKTLRFAKRLVDSNLSERVSYCDSIDKGGWRTDKRHFVN